MTISPAQENPEPTPQNTHRPRFGDKASPRRRRTLASLAVGLVISLGVIAIPAAPAFAYTTTGCKWNTGSLRIDYRYVNGNFRTAINQAKNTYNASTDVSLSTVDVSGPSFTAQNNNYGATGYEAQATWSCFFGATNAAQIRVNQYYLSGIEPITRLKVVWAHEIGHALGLGHVTPVARVMYSSASAAYNNGVTGLTFDEIYGINALY